MSHPDPAATRAPGRHPGDVPPIVSSSLSGRPPTFAGVAASPRVVPGSAVAAERGLEAHVAAALATAAMYGTVSSSAVLSLLSESTEGIAEYAPRAGGAAVVLWLAHLFAHWFGAAVAHRRLPGRHPLLREAALTSPIALAVLPQLVPFVLADTGVWSEDTASWVWFGLVEAVLLGAGLAVGLRRGVGVVRTTGFVLAVGMLGTLVIALKELVH